MYVGLFVVVGFVCGCLGCMVCLCGDGIGVVVCG